MHKGVLFSSEPNLLKSLKNCRASFSQNKLEHTVLNAKNHAKEAEIVADAGKAGAITIATNMAGRGTDIKLEAGDRSN